MFVWKPFSEEEVEWVWVEGVGEGSLVFHWVLYSPLRGEKEKGGVPLVSHKRRKPARGIPQAALTHRLEVSGATLGLTATSLQPATVVNSTTFTFWHYWVFQSAKHFNPNCIFYDVAVYFLLHQQWQSQCNEGSVWQNLWTIFYELHFSILTKNFLKLLKCLKSHFYIW